MDANLPVYDLKTMERVVDEDLFSARMVAVLSATFAGLAGLLAALGIYGVLAYVVVQRTREIGIRMALGAVAGHVRLMIFKEVGLMVLIGVAVGLPLRMAWHDSANLCYTACTRVIPWYMRWVGGDRTDRACGMLHSGEACDTRRSVGGAAV